MSGWYFDCYRNHVKQLQRITIDPGVMGGKPCIRGMRVTVGVIVASISAGRTLQDLLARTSRISRNRTFAKRLHSQPAWLKAARFAWPTDRYGCSSIATSSHEIRFI